ncbi:MAG: ABC transporter permease [Gemmatimonadetes bacterium]|nr:ABC transporter permease [Gemmatimonadota bacterium]
MSGESREGGGNRALPEALVRRVEELVERSGLEAGARREVRDELIAHCEDGLAAGRSPEEVLETFGEVARTARLIAQERGARVSRRSWWRAFAEVGRDTRLAWRRCRRSPGFVITALLSLIIGIGANTAIFTLVNAILVRDQPYTDPDALYHVYITSPDTEYGTFAYPDMVDVRDGTQGLVDALAATQFTIVQAERDGSADIEMLPVELVNGDYFPGLGIDAAIGRTLGVEDDVAPGAHPVVMLGHDYWRRGFDNDPGVIGRELRLAGMAYTIVGVAPRRFAGSLRGIAPDLFLPIRMVREISQSGQDPFTERSNHALFVKARLADGVTRDALAAALDGIATDLRRRGEWRKDAGFRLIPVSDVVIYPPVDRFIRAAAWLLTAVVGLVLLIACANLASFLTARAVDRRREMAVRLSLGATRGALVRQLLTETTLLSVCAGGLGVLASVVALSWLTNADLPLPLPITLDLSPDRSVLLYSLVVSAAAGIAFGLAPALHSTRAGLATVLRDESPGGGRRGKVTLRGLLVTGQVAVTLALLTMAGLLLRSFQATQSVDPGFGSTPTAVVTMGLRADRWSEAEGLAFTRTMVERLEEVAGVTGIALTGRLHLDPLNTWEYDINVDGVAPPPDEDGYSIDWTPVTPAFFEVMGIPILRGRGFTEADREGSLDVAVINQAMAARFWPDGDPVGRTFRNLRGKVLTVVGVAADAKVRNLGEDPRPQLYLPFAQEYASGFSLLANTTRDPEVVALELARAARDIDRDIFTWEPKSLSRHLGQQLLARRLAAWIVGAFAGLAMVLATVGLYGLVSYAVSQRRREVGIRMSLGADRGRIVRLLLGNGLRVVLAGAIAGVAGSLALARLLRGLLYGVEAIDPLTFLAVPSLLVTVALFAAWLPARSATRTDPAVTLRTE